jgi:hypothetical protein
MPLSTWTTCALAFVGEDLFISRVAGGAMGGAHEHRLARVDGFASMRAAQAAEALRPHRPSRSERVCVLLPAELVSAKSVPLGCRAWSRASAELQMSVERLLPLDREHAALGMIERAEADGAIADAAGDQSERIGAGSLLGVDERAMARWLEPVASAFGRAPDLVLAWPQALLGLGAQDLPAAIVYDQTALGAPVHHVLRRGAVSQLGLVGHPAPGRDATAILMPGVDAPPGAASVRRLDGYDLATAAALAEHVAPELFVPLRGRRRSALGRWAPAATAAVAGLALLVAAQWYGDGRHQAEIARIERASEEISASVAQAEARRQRLVSLSAALAQIDQAWSAADPQIIEAYRALRDAVPAEGYLYSVEITGQRARLVAEAPRAAAVLEKVEGSPHFRGASMRPPSSVAERTGMERFEITAPRVIPGAPQAEGDRR